MPPRRTVVKASSKGRLYLDWEPMPRVPDEYLECVVYLYPSIPAAESGEMVGGSGFIIRTDQGDNDFYYVVTNKHVLDAGSHVVRFNTISGGHEAFEFDERNWFRSDTADLAIYLIPDLTASPRRLKLRPVDPGAFITQEKMRHLDLGIGDEVFFAGRFINAEGKDRNRPSLRFGTIAQTDTDLIDGEESFLVEARSIPGYSGSPVFTFTLAGTPRDIRSASVPMKGYGPFLLGVDWCHISDYVTARDQYGNDLQFKIKSNSGMMGVVPAWNLNELLFRQDVMDDRDRQPKKVRAASPDVAVGKPVPSANDANPTHREDFTHLVDAAARKREPEG
jgi:hypothetical protein